MTWLIIAINVIVWLLMELNGGSDNSDTLIAFGAKVNELIDQGQVWRLLTAMFLHIGIIHLTVNQYSLYAVGTLLERFMGATRFAILYVFAGLCGSLASYWFSPNAISAGASGAIFGLLGALGIFFLLHRRLFGPAGNRMLANIVAVAAINLVLGASFAGIDNFAHVGGLLGGVALGALLTPRYEIIRDLNGVPQVRRRDSFF
jgi:rhomboid protease GluP